MFVLVQVSNKLHICLMKSIKLNEDGSCIVKIKNKLFNARIIYKHSNRNPLRGMKQKLTDMGAVERQLIVLLSDKTFERSAEEVIVNDQSQDKIVKVSVDIGDQVEDHVVEISPTPSSNTNAACIQSLTTNDEAIYKHVILLSNSMCVSTVAEMPTEDLLVDANVDGLLTNEAAEVQHSVCDNAKIIDETISKGTNKAINQPEINPTDEEIYKVVPHSNNNCYEVQQTAQSLTSNISEVNCESLPDSNSNSEIIPKEVKSPELILRNNKLFEESSPTVTSEAVDESEDRPTNGSGIQVLANVSFDCYGRLFPKKISIPIISEKNSGDAEINNNEPVYENSFEAEGNTITSWAEKEIPHISHLSQSLNETLLVPFPEGVFSSTPEYIQTGQKGSLEDNFEGQDVRDRKASDDGSDSDPDYVPIEDDPNEDDSNEDDPEAMLRSTSVDFPVESVQLLPENHSWTERSSANMSIVGACDDSKLHVEKSKGPKGDKKFHFCPYCFTKQQKFARHLLIKHNDVQDVIKFKDLPVGSDERRKIIDVIRKHGDYLFNTDTNYNDGELIVRRRPNKTRPAKHFKACPECKAYFSQNSLRVHFQICARRTKSKKRQVLVMSKQVMGRLHPVANITVRKLLFPKLREDRVVRIIRYDALVMLFCNKMVIKYKNVRHFDMIRARVRVVGRFLLAMRESNEDISDLLSIFDPKYCDSAITAINKVAVLDPDTNVYRAPTAALTLGTLLKQIGNILITECIKKHDPNRRRNAEDFLKILGEDLALVVNRDVAECHLQRQRRKKVELPSMDDIKLLRSFLEQKRAEAFQKLSLQFSIGTWNELAQLTLISLQLFNRRRAGEIERILIEDFNSYQAVDAVTNKDLYNSLSPEGKNFANKYVRFLIRGKLNLTVPVLMNKPLLDCVKLLLQYRKDAKVDDKNPYVFGLSGESNACKYLRACALLRKYSVECGATNPKTLRGTQLRKHIATACLNLNLSDGEVTDLANFLGHDEKIHKNIYRQPVLTRDILQMSKILEAAQGADLDDESENSEESDDENLIPE